VSCRSDHLAPQSDAPAAPGLVPWEFAGLLLTYWCNARCAICYTCSGPDRDALLDVPAALALWRGLDRLAAAHGKTMRIHLAGGEPFRDWVRLVAILRAARDAGLTPAEKVETNAFWATHDGLTRTRLELLDALGVGKLVVSTDVYHQEFVPFDHVRRCVEIARQVLRPARVQLRWREFYEQPIETRALSVTQREQGFRAALTRHKDRLTGRAARRLAPLLPCQPAEAFRGLTCTRELLQSRHVHIDPCGFIFPGTCLGIILGRAGAAETGPTVEALWHDLAVNWRRNPVVDALVAGGSYELLQRVRALGYVERPAGYASKCHLCAEVRQCLVERGLWSEFVGPPECYLGPEAEPRPSGRAT